MGEDDRNSAQCAWLFCHAHLTGETCIKFEYGIQIYFPALVFVFAAGDEDFFTLADPFLTVFTTGLALAAVLVVFFATLFALAGDLRGRFSRSARSNSS